MLHDIQVLLSRLVMKAGQLIRNFTTNLAEGWMQVRCKFDRGKSCESVSKWVMGTLILWCWATAKFRKNLGTTHLGENDHLSTYIVTKFLSTQQNPLPRKLRQHVSERLQKMPRKADEGASTPDLTTQLQLAKLTCIADMTMTLNPTTLLTMFH